MNSMILAVGRISSTYAMNAFVANGPKNTFSEKFKIAGFLSDHLRYDAVNLTSAISILVLIIFFIDSIIKSTGKSIHN